MILTTSLPVALDSFFFCLSDTNNPVMRAKKMFGMYLKFLGDVVVGGGLSLY